MLGYQKTPLFIYTIFSSCELKKKDNVNLKKNEDEYMRWFGGRKGKEEIL